jgi:hypothetical protein
MKNCLTEEEILDQFNRWWASSKYTQVVYTADLFRQAALDGFRARNNLMPRSTPESFNTEEHTCGPCNCEDCKPISVETHSSLEKFNQSST